MTVMSDSPIGADGPIPKAALALGWAGVLPFAAGAVGLFFVPLAGLSREDLTLPVLGYGAVILSFLGGVRWGAALSIRHEPTQARALALAVVPSLVAWVAVALHARPLIGLALLALAHVIQGLVDVRAAAAGELVGWYGRLRVQLASAATAALVVAAAALAFRG